MPSPFPSKRLDSWKEIAAYLKCDERTAMRWQESGLPVHRTPGGGRGRVFAFTTEIDDWLAGPKPSEAETPTASTVSPTPTDTWLNRIPRIVQAGFLAALFIGLYAATALIWKATTAAPLPLASVGLRENNFVGVDKTGRALWTYALPTEFAEKLPTRSPAIAYVGDLEGNGKKEALASVPLPGDFSGAWVTSESELYAFSETGRLLWHFEPKETLAFGSGDYGPPWPIRAWLVYRTGGKSRIALAVHHNLWWPSVLRVLDWQGKELGRFVNSGTILTLSSMDTPAGPLLMAGGVRNHEDEVSGMFAVLDGNHVSGSSPESKGSGFECKSCPVGRPLHYFVFPRSELNSLIPNGYNQVISIVPSGEGVRVFTEEAVASEPTVSSNGIFEFSRDFHLQRASYSDGYRELHKRWEREGKIHHSWENCPDRFGPRLIRSWDPQQGWTEIHPQQARR